MAAPPHVWFFLRLWRLWLLANTLPWLICGGLCLGLFGPEVKLPLLIAAWLLACGWVGWAQWQVLRRHLPAGVRAWTLATAMGGALGLPAFGLLLLAPAGFGLTIGAAQWWVLRGRVPQAWRWWVACGVNGVLAVGVVYALGSWLSHNLAWGLVLMGTVIEVISSVTTGWVWLQWVAPPQTVAGDGGS